MSAREQAQAVRARRLRAETLMEATLERIHSVNSTVNAIVALRDETQLLAEARTADSEDPVGPLHGLPIAIKDLADVSGLPTSQGSSVFAGRLATADSPHVAALRKAGVIFIGKTNTPEFGLGGHTYNPVHGITSNPYDLSLSCGGSSGGAAVALATGMVSIADGSDMMGSLRNPAGWNNVYGFRPSWGRVPRNAAGDVYLHRLSTNGPMARCPEDIGLLLDVMSQPQSNVPAGPLFEPVCPVGPLTDLRVAWLGDWGGAWPYEDGIISLCEAALQALSGTSAKVEAHVPPFDRDALWRSWSVLRSWAIGAELLPLYDDPTLRTRLKPEAIWEIEQGRSLSAMEVHTASTLRSEWLRASNAFFERFDVMALPTAQVWPFDKELSWPDEIAGYPMDTYHRWMEVTIPASLLGLPSIAVPAGFGSQGLPMGLQLICRHGDDARLLALAEAYHQITRWPDVRPPVL